MRSVVIAWLRYLEGHEGVLGLILIACGLSLMSTGWRFSRISLVLIYGIIGMALGLALGAQAWHPFWCAILGGGVCAAFGVAMGRHATPILAGLLGSLTVWVLLEATGFPFTTIYLAMGLTFLTIGAASVIRKRATTIVLTSFVGAILLMSGLVAIVSESRTLAVHYQDISRHGLFVSFVLLVLTVSGILLQLSAANRSDAGVVVER